MCRSEYMLWLVLEDAGRGAAEALALTMLRPSPNYCPVT